MQEIGETGVLMPESAVPVDPLVYAVFDDEGCVESFWAKEELEIGYTFSFRSLILKLRQMGDMKLHKGHAVYGGAFAAEDVDLIVPVSYVKKVTVH